MDTGHDGEPSTRIYTDREYFKQLARSLQPRRSPLALAGSDANDGGRGPSREERVSELAHLVPSPEDGSPDERVGAGGRTASEGLSEGSFNQGYYERFFLEQKKLGKGLRGSVFSCQHILDNVYLGRYAVKKVAVGDNHQWLKRMLREVKLLESLRHPNVVEYKHSWLEMHQLSVFGPRVPCLFILMEYANGGNLQEYMEAGSPAAGGDGDGDESSMSLKGRILRKRRQSRLAQDAPAASSQDPSARGRRILTVDQIWSFFSDICGGLAHLHQLQIVHRDLKHMNLLLQWKDTGRGDASDDTPRIMLTDFGECEILSHLEKRDRTGATGTMEFMAPELLEVDEAGRYLDIYTTKSDMWSLGMVLYYLCYTRLPFTSIDDIDVLRRDVLRLQHVDMAAIRRPEGAEEIPQELRRIIQLLLNHNEAKRPDIGDIVRLVDEYSDLWRSRQFGKSRFEMHDSDMASSLAASSAAATPRLDSPTPGSGGGDSFRGAQTVGSTVTAAPGPSRLSRETLVGDTGIKSAEGQSGNAALGSYTLVGSPSQAGARPGTSGELTARPQSQAQQPSSAPQRHTADHQLLLTSAEPTNMAGAHGGHANGSLRYEYQGARSIRHDSAMCGSTKHEEVWCASGPDDGSEATGSGSTSTSSSSSSTGAAPDLGTKRHGAAMDGGRGDVSSGRATKRQRFIADLEIGPVFCVKTALLLAKSYALQRIGTAKGVPPEKMMHMAWLSLVLSALDIHHQSLRLTLLLLVANVGAVCWWLHFID
ncbi:putative serine/threonine-protein kinase iks1 [Coemansia biformis]|uniref:non-specific serine/threonine protein kinase n=1 Tax=Coemansia biformis TaxID=1286918 RepID=A0A9W7YCN9_9FUNG|nr:putative serine/threonine-protein kinase iks1 [Coemansia biformis]